MEEGLGAELLGLSIMVLAGKALGDATEKYGYGRIVGEIVGGAVLGPFALGGLVNHVIGVSLFTVGSEVVFLSELSVILLIFASGLEHGSAPLRTAGVWGALGAIGGALTPFGLTLALRGALGLSLEEALLAGAAIAPTSLAVVAGSIRRLSPGDRVVSFLLSAAALDDVVSLVLLSVAEGLASAKGSPVDYLRVAAFYSVAWATIYVVSIKLIPAVVARTRDRYIVETSLIILFGLITVMQGLGFSPIIAAFIAGVSLGESVSSSRLSNFMESLLLVFGSIFFVVVGAEFDAYAVSLRGVVVAVAIAALAMAGKMAGSLPFAYGASRDAKRSAIASIGMEPRGEVGFAIASYALQEGLITSGCYGVMTLSILLTTIAGAAAFGRLSRGLVKPVDE